MSFPSWLSRSSLGRRLDKHFFGTNFQSDCFDPRAWNGEAQVSSSKFFFFPPFYFQCLFSIVYFSPFVFSISIFKSQNSACFSPVLEAFGKSLWIHCGEKNGRRPVAPHWKSCSASGVARAAKSGARSVAV